MWRQPGSEPRLRIDGGGNFHPFATTRKEPECARYRVVKSALVFTPPTPEVAGWVKVLIGTVVGFVSAIFADLIKSGIREAKRRKRLQHAIYSELAQLYNFLHNFPQERISTPHVQKATTNLLRHLRTDSYKFAKSQPDIFYELPEASEIDALYGYLHFIQSGEPLHVEGLLEMGEALRRHIEDALATNRINVEMLKETDPKTFESIRQNAALKKGQSIT